MKNEYEQFKNTSTPILERIKEAASHQLQKQSIVVALTQQLKEETEKLKNLEENIVPELFEEAGIESIKLESGKTVTVKESPKASIPAATSYKTYDWLDDQGYGGMIKRQVVIDFGKQSEEVAEKIKQELIDRGENGLNIKDQKSIHYQTLQSFVRGKMEEGIELPEDYFSIFRQRKSIIK